MRLRKQRLDDGRGDLVEGLAADDRLLFEQAEILPLANGQAVELDVAGRGRHGSRRHRADRLPHRLLVLAGRRPRVVGEQRRQARLDRPRGHDAGRFPAIAAACSAVMITLPLFGSTTTSGASARSIASTMFAVEGFIDWPPSTMCATPRLS